MWILCVNFTSIKKKCLIAGLLPWFSILCASWEQIILKCQQLVILKSLCMGSDSFDSGWELIAGGVRRLSSSILSAMMLVLQGWVGQRPGWAYCCWQIVTICVHQKTRWPGPLGITNCWNVLRAVQPTLRLLAVGTCYWQGMRISPLHLLTFLVAWPKQAKIGQNDLSCSRTARHELKCLLYGQGTS